MLINPEKIKLKTCQTINEDLIQDYIFQNPNVLGLGELTPLRREKVQPSGGRFDLLLSDDDNNRYEVEVQLGATDPSHIIRTLEYWDLERKRYPNFNHCAVIIAEDITGRFMNVISLFNGTIPIIALQLSAHKFGDDIAITFTKVLDRITLGTDEEDEYEITDRKYWDNRSTPKILKDVDNIFNDLGEIVADYELKYNKFYIGVAKNGITKNFISFKPKKNFLHLNVKGELNDDTINEISNAGLEITFDSRYSQYSIRLRNYEDYRRNQKLLNTLIEKAKLFYNA